MIAVDTNIVIRLLTGDHPNQSVQAMHLFNTQDILLPTTVLLEAFWVLRKRFNQPQAEILRQFDALTRLPRVTVADTQGFAIALSLSKAGMSFADAMHLASVKAGQKFATFDADLIRIAQNHGVEGVFAP